MGATTDAGSGLATPAPSRAARIAAADQYLADRTGRYAWRCVRYDAALTVMHELGLDDRCTVMDVGSGWGEFGARMHTGRLDVDMGGRVWPYPPSLARYIPVDAGNDGTDLDNNWHPPRDADYIVALEIVEHLTNPAAFLNRLCLAARRAVIVSTPNPDTTDVLGMDPTHRSIIGRSRLTAHGFKVETRSFYGAQDDSLFAVWTP